MIRRLMPLMMVISICFAAMPGAQETKPGVIEFEKEESAPAMPEPDWSGAGILNVTFDYTEQEGPGVCAGAGSYSVLIQTGEMASETVRVDVARDSGVVAVDKWGVARARAKRGDKDSLVLAIESLILGVRTITVQQYAASAPGVEAPMYEETTRADIIPGVEVEILVPTVVGKAPTVKYPKGYHEGEGVAAATEPVKADVVGGLQIKPVGKALVEGKGGVTAAAGFSGKTEVGAGILLDGTASKSSAGKEISYEWSLLSGPAAEIKDSKKRTATLVPSKPGLHRVQLRVSDGKFTQYDEIRINVTGKLNLSEPAVVSRAKADLDGDSLYLIKGMAVVMARRQMAFQIFDIKNKSEVKKSELFQVEYKDYRGNRVFGRTWMSGSRLYAVAEGKQGETALMVFDFSDPMSPLLTGVADLPHKVSYMAVSGGRLYAADPAGGKLKILDVSNVNAPAKVKEYDLSLLAARKMLQPFEIVGDTFVGGSGNLVAMDLSNGKVSELFPIDNGVVHFTVGSGALYVFPMITRKEAEGEILRVYAFPDGKSVVRKGALAGKRAGVFKAGENGNYLYFGRETEDGREIIFVDVSNQDKPREVFKDKSAGAVDFEVDGDYIVALGRAGLETSVVVLKTSK